MSTDGDALSSPSLAGSTDELPGGIEQTERSVDPSPPLPSFEHRRTIAAARERLFGVRTSLRIGRFEIVGRLGAGAMGEVYLGLDEQLGRKIAIKRVLAASGGERAQARLRREARALAKLSHPNVVQIYEIGEHEDRTYLAMEYVEGQTLATWLARGEHAWQEIVDRFIAAGRGLAAAHRAGVIHRDFKPENVLLGDAGEVRVADFGLALADHEVVPRTRSGGAPSDLRLSTTGAVIGTIRFMPLEQLRGEPVDERSDQFAFCIALYEALWGQPPFDLGSAHARLAALERDQPNPPSGNSPVFLWRAIRRGLARDPPARWPDMTSLLDALARRTSRARVFGVAALAGTLGLAGAASLMLLDDPPQDDEATCVALERELTGIWDDSRRDALASVFDRATVEHAASSRERVLAELDGWAAAWVDERTRVCRASEAHTLDPELARLEGLCLARARQQAGRLVDELLATDTPLAGAIEASAELGDPARCADELALLGVPPPARSIEAEVEALRGDVLQAHDLRLLGRFDQALALAELTQARAEQLEFGPLIAEAAAERAKLEFVAGSRERGAELFDAAIDLAEAHHHDRLAAELLTSASLRASTDLDDAEAAARYLHEAEIAWQRVEPDARDRVRMAFARGRIAALAKRDDEAETEYLAALGMLEGTELRDGPAIHSALADLLKRRDPSRSMAEREAARALAEQLWGPDHPETAFYVYKLGHALERAGEHERGRPMVERAAAIWTEALTRPHPSLATARATLAQIALGEGRLDDAEQQAVLLERAQVSLPAQHRDRGEPELIRATVAAMRGDRAGALLHDERALEFWLPTLGAAHPRVIHVQTEIANHLLGLGRLDDAGQRYRALLAQDIPPERALAVWIGLAEVELRRGELDEAAAALARVDTLGLSSLAGQELNIAMLDALIALRRGQLGRERDTLAELLATSKIPLAQLSGWLDELGLSEADRRALGLLGE
ncbi:protein kinase domain-containing protein [Nannocystaceae bacterium ST9]